MVQPWPLRVARSSRSRSAAVFLAVSSLTSACSMLLGIHDVPPADEGADAQTADAGDDYVIPKGDGPPCRFDDDAARFDDLCTFAP